MLLDLLEDWGGFLQLPLYYDALTCFFGGEDEVVRHVPVMRGDKQLMAQKVHLLNPHTAFKLTAFPDHMDIVHQHLQRFLCHTSLEALQWVNLHHHTIEFKTLLNNPR